MINLALSLLAGVALGLLLGIWLTPIEAILPALVVVGVVYFLLARRAMNKLEAVFLSSQKDLMAGRIEKAIRIIESARPVGRWQFLVGAQIDAQIGMIHFVREDFKTAQPYLERALSRLWIPKAMLGSLLYKKKDVEAMRTNFEKAVSVGKKQGLAWSIYAWCEWKLGNVERAIAILNRGEKVLKDDDDKLKANLLALQNGKKMKMKGYGDQWYQFHLETMPALKQQNVRFARR
ncbi:MAG: hypothetical protein ABIJ09_19535 [Pseudomonadota bacterium]